MNPGADMFEPSIGLTLAFTLLTLAIAAQNIWLVRRSAPSAAQARWTWMAAGAIVLGRIAHAAIAESCAQLGELSSQLAGGLGRNRSAHDMQHRPSVEPGLHLHDRHTGFLITCHHCAVDRRRPAPAWQDRSMDVEASICWGVEYRLRQDQAVCRYDCDIRTKRRKLALRFFIAQGFGRSHLNPQFLALGMDG